jgi:hypothetical protein
MKPVSPCFANGRLMARLHPGSISPSIGLCVRLVVVNFDTPNNHRRKIRLSFRVLLFEEYQCTRVGFWEAAVEFETILDSLEFILGVQILDNPCVLVDRDFRQFMD